MLIPIDFYSFNTILLYDRDYLKLYDKIKKDPYKYILSPYERNKCYHRVKRFFFVSSLLSLYVYQNVRYHQELGRIRSLKFNVIQLLHLPKVLGLGALLYLFANVLFVDRQKIKIHSIAQFELQKFDKEWYIYNQANNGIFNAPAYKDPNSVWGSMTLTRLLYDVDQSVGWINRLRELKPEILKEVPPKYDSTPMGPRDMKKVRQDWPFFSKNEFVK